MTNIQPENSGEKWVLGVGSRSGKYLPIMFFLIAVLAILLTFYSWFIRNIWLLFLFFPQAIGFLLLTLLQFERWNFYRIILRQEKMIQDLKKSMPSPQEQNK